MERRHFQQAMDDLQDRFDDAYSDIEVKEIWGRCCNMTQQHFVSVVAGVYATARGRLPGLGDWYRVTQSLAPTASHSRPSARGARERFVPREWIKELREAISEGDRSRIRELGKRKMEAGEVPSLCPRCRGTGFEPREAMTDHRHPIPIAWPCENGCVQMTRDRDDNEVQAPFQVTPGEARMAWMSRTRGRFLLDGQEPGG